jgi:hypothetical protein
MYPDEPTHFAKEKSARTLMVTTLPRNFASGNPASSIPTKKGLFGADTQTEAAAIGGEN